VERLIKAFYRIFFGLDVTFMTDLERLVQRQADLITEINSLVSELAAVNKQIDIEMVRRAEGGAA
jgi:hypothetical protein